MRYTTHINNVKCLEWGLNATQGALFDLLNQLSSWAKEIIIEKEVFYFISKNKILEELPLFFKQTDPIYRNLKKLEKLGLIRYLKDGKKDLIKLTNKGKNWNCKSKDDNSVLEPSKNENLGSKTEKNENNSVLKPTYNTTTSYKNTKSINKEKKSQKSLLLENFVLTLETLEKLKNEGYQDKQINKTMLSFKDYWILGDGKKKKKINWQSTFRIWIRRKKPWNKSNETNFKKKAEIEEENEQWVKEQRALGRFQQ